MGFLAASRQYCAASARISRVCPTAKRMREALNRNHADQKSSRGVIWMGEKVCSVLGLQSSNNLLFVYYFPLGAVPDAPELDSRSDHH